MTTDATVRAWCREQGIEVPSRGKLSSALREQYAEAHGELLDDDDQGEQLDDDQDDDGGERAPVLSLVEAPAPETPPRSPRPRKLTGLFSRAAARRPRSGPKRRVSLESTLAGGWSILAAAAAQTGRGPTGRVLAMQAPVAGVILEDALKGTLADRVLQPLARSAQSASKVGALLGPPVLVTLLDMHPEWAPQILPILHTTMRQWVLVAGPALKAQEKKAAKAMEALGVEDDTSLDQMINAMIEAIFDPEGDGQAVTDAAA